MVCGSGDGSGISDRVMEALGTVGTVGCVRQLSVKLPLRMDSLRQDRCVVQRVLGGGAALNYTHSRTKLAALFRPVGHYYSVELAVFYCSAQACGSLF